MEHRRWLGPHMPVHGHRKCNVYGYNTETYCFVENDSEFSTDRCIGRRHFSEGWFVFILIQNPICFIIRLNFFFQLNSTGLRLYGMFWTAVYVSGGMTHQKVGLSPKIIAWANHTGSLCIQCFGPSCTFMYVYVRSRKYCPQKKNITDYQDQNPSNDASSLYVRYCPKR